MEVLQRVRGETCRQLRHRRSGTKPIGRRAIGILSILQASTIGDFFSELGLVSVAWRKTSRQPTGGVNSTPTNTARAELRSMITFHHASTRGSRAGRLRIAHLCAPETIVIHVSCLNPCRTWRWPQAQLLSPISSISLLFPTVSHTRSMAFDPYLLAMFHGRVADQHKSHLSQVVSQVDRDQVGWDQSHRDRSDRAWGLRAQQHWAWQESWDRSVSNTGKICEKSLPKSYLEKLVQRHPTSSHKCIPIMTQRKALQTRILMMENYENDEFTTVETKSRGV